jgi:hypothetical protein
MFPPTCEPLLQTCELLPPTRTCGLHLLTCELVRFRTFPPMLLDIPVPTSLLHLLVDTRTLYLGQQRHSEVVYTLRVMFSRGRQCLAHGPPLLCPAGLECHSLEVPPRACLAGCRSPANQHNLLLQRVSPAQSTWPCHLLTSQIRSYRV